MATVARAACRYRFTVKLSALLMPPVVVTVTLTTPFLAVAGTLHLICVSLQETYTVHVLVPNLTELAPRARAEARAADGHGRAAPAGGGLSLTMLGAGVARRRHPAARESPSCR